MRRRLVSVYIMLAVIVTTMFPLSMGSLAQTPVAAPNTEISGTIDVAMVANPQMVALQEVVAGGEAEGLVRDGPPELWTDVWLALVAFAAENGIPGAGIAPAAALFSPVPTGTTTRRSMIASIAPTAA